MIAAVIFDMDGLLIESEQFWEQARREFAQSVECAWSETEELGVKGHNSPEWARAIRDHCTLHMPVDRIIEGVVQRMERLYAGGVPLLPGAHDVVVSLSATYPLAVASSSPTSLIEYVLRTAGLRERFSAVVSADAAGRGKPSPDVFLMAAEQLSVEAGHIAVFEDSASGITAAHRGGMKVIAVPNPHYPPGEDALWLADVVLQSLTDFTPALLDRL